jgi:shikimate kinase
MAERRPYYEEVATSVIDTNRRTTEEVADEVLALAANPR